jgi:hypothetical protein
MGKDECKYPTAAERFYGATDAVTAGSVEFGKIAAHQSSSWSSVANAMDTLASPLFLLKATRTPSLFRARRIAFKVSGLESLPRSTLLTVPADNPARVASVA